MIAERITMNRREARVSGDQKNCEVATKLIGYTEGNFYVFSVHGRSMDHFQRMSILGTLTLYYSTFFRWEMLLLLLSSSTSAAAAATATFFYSFGGFKINFHEK
jgi:hypothetical protein